MAVWQCSHWSSLVLNSLSEESQIQLIDVLTEGRSSDTIATLTGRAPLWAEVIHSIIERPLHAYGFQGYRAGYRMLELGDSTRWSARGAHNRYLECMFSIGGIRGTLFVLALVIALHRTTVGFRISKDLRYWVAFSWLVFAMMHSMAARGRKTNVIPRYGFHDSVDVARFSACGVTEATTQNCWRGLGDASQSILGDKPRVFRLEVDDLGSC